MTKVTISGNASGTGNVNFSAPNTNSAITVTLPTSNVDMDNLGPSTTASDVGTYGFFANDGTSGVDSRNFGGTLTGSKLLWKNGLSGQPGTWRAMGDGAARQGYNLWVRIS